MVLSLLLAACGRPGMISAEVAFATPSPGDEVCHADLDAEVDVSSLIDSGADAVLLAFFDDLAEDEAWDPAGRLKVISTAHLKEGEHDGTLTGTVDWDDVVDEGRGRVLLVADVGDFPELQEGDWMDVEDYEDAVDVADVWARATVSVKVCPI
ncbi:MAG: hypothetical protein ACOZNI_23460 [Myxococcota bacterium]